MPSRRVGSCQPAAPRLVGHPVSTEVVRLCDGGHRHAGITTGPAETSQGIMTVFQRGLYDHIEDLESGKRKGKNKPPEKSKGLCVRVRVRVCLCG